MDGVAQNPKPQPTEKKQIKTDKTNKTLIRYGQRGEEQEEQEEQEEERGGAGHRKGSQLGEALEQPRGVSVAGNISTLACMKDRSGREAITAAASALRCSSFLGFLLDRRRYA